ncbi:MAG: hypothetical protein HKM98_10985 [Gammaproteobacteria bacterium]|nr:hypothetical protein [Gammaproteobacteria bacterium]
MHLIVAAFAVMILTLSIWGVVSPTAIVNLVRRATGPAFMFIAVGVRIALGLLLWFAADAARHPVVFKVLAIVMFVAAITILAVGKARVLRLIDWVADQSGVAQRAWLLLGVGFGTYLLWEVWPAVAINI